MGYLFRVACLVSLSFALSQPAGSQNCTPDKETANRHFIEAHTALFDYLSLAHLCAPYLGQAFVTSGISKTEDFMAQLGIGRNDAIILAEVTNQKAIGAAAKYDLPAIAKQTGNETTISMRCIDQLNNAMHQYDVARAKMAKAQCAP